MDRLPPWPDGPARVVPGLGAPSVTALDPAAEAVLRDAALLGRRIDSPLLAAVNGTDVEGVEAALTAGRDLTLLQVDDLGVRFRHSLTRAALLADLSPAQRAERSAHALAALRAARRDYTEPVPFSLFTFTDPDGVALELMYLAA